LRGCYNYKLDECGGNQSVNYNPLLPEAFDCRV
jgi:hypothetical protein